MTASESVTKNPNHERSGDERDWVNTIDTEKDKEKQTNDRKKGRGVASEEQRIPGDPIPTAGPNSQKGKGALHCTALHRTALHCTAQEGA